MINGFEDETEELTQYELEELLPVLVEHLPKKIGIKKAVTNAKMVRGLKDMGLNVNGPRLRKLINYIRRKNLVSNLIATSRGYYIPVTTQEFANYVESLRQRENAIRAVRIAMQQQLEDRVNHSLDL